MNYLSKKEGIKMKKLRLRQGVKDVLVIALFYLIIVVGVVLINYRFEQIKSVDTEAPTQYTNAN